MKRLIAMLLASVLLLGLTACGYVAEESKDFGAQLPPVTERYADAVHIALSDHMTEVPAGVTMSNDIIYYEEGHDFTYGEGTQADEHSAEEAAAHRVVTITEPGTYLLTGTLSAGQIAVNLGEGAQEDPNAVVTLILGGADVTCTVAPAVIFYNVYECGNGEQADKNVDTSAAGANVVIADGTVNTVNGAYVARIYKSVVLSDDGSEVVDSKKLHKYDGAFYSKMSMNINGGEIGNGRLVINGENEGLDSELHLTINGGNILINSGNDGINTNEDGVSVTTINGGTLEILVNGSTGEGDGIDSNGWLVINGGTVIAQACGASMDGGIDSDMGIHINGGTVFATGNMTDAISASKATYGVFRFAQSQKGGETVTLKKNHGEQVLEWAPMNPYSTLVVAAPELTAGDYTLWIDGVQMAGTNGGMDMGGFGMGGMQIPEGFDPAEPGGMERPEGFDPAQPGGMERPEGFDPAQSGGMQRPEGNRGGADFDRELVNMFTFAEGGNQFTIMGKA